MNSSALESRDHGLEITTLQLDAEDSVLDCDDGALSAAKRQLLKDVDNIKSQVGIDLCHVPLRREGEHRAQREVDDIFSILNYRDERSAISKLPTNVTNGPDKMPSTRLYEGDSCAFMGILEKMDHWLNTLGSAVSAINRDL